MSTPVLGIRREGAVTVLELDRPRARNSLSPELVGALGAALRAARGDDRVRAVIITGAGGDFCAGADITAFDDLRAAPLIGGDDPLWRELTDFPKPVIAAVEGFALGGGFELALACDIVIASESARFGVPEVKLGVIPGAGGTQRRTRSAGKSTAMLLLMSGDFLDADRALAAGLVSEVTVPGAALASALTVAARIARNSPLAVALAKDAARASYETVLAQGLEHEKRNFRLALESEDCREGQAAFLAKRTPEFTGR